MAPMPEVATALTARELPQAEWAKLRGTELAYLADITAPILTWVLVVEQDGEIIGCWARMLTDHVEGLWEHPDHRGKGGVSRLLFTAMVQHLQQAGVRNVLTQSVDPQIDQLLEHIGGTPVPGQTWVFPVPESR